MGAPPSPAVGGRFQGAAAGPLEGAPEGELKRGSARLAGRLLLSLSSGLVWLCQELKAVGQAAGGVGQWALMRELLLLLPFTDKDVLFSWICWIS